MSKTVEQLLEEVNTNEKLQNDLKTALETGKESVATFMKDNGCDASVEEAKTYIEKLSNKMIDEGEITPEQLEQVSGGTILPPGIGHKIKESICG